MKFIQLVSALQLTDAQLARALASDDKAARHARLLRDSAVLLERIETYEPESTEELREMVGFFMARATRHTSSDTGKHDFAIAAALMKRYGNADLPCRAPMQDPEGSGALFVASGSDPSDIARQIVLAGHRVAAIDANYRYLATSRVNAAFYKMSPLALVGRHLCETIGSDRFHKRARGKIDLCLAGNKQDYLFRAHDPIAGQRVMRCRMTPVRDARKRVFCALVQLRDTTGSAQAQEIAQNEPGTT